jgi:hypothetical protein
LNNGTPFAGWYTLASSKLRLWLRPEPNLSILFIDFGYWNFSLWLGAREH